ncbi:MAG: cation:proton antiporter [Acidobacteria bacterium]|nr:cation:proton antiporter [Acidobacteriota bacterium]
METSSFLRDLVVLFGVAVVISYGFHSLRLSTIPGFLVAGALVGPFGLRWISSVQDVERMAEIGVMLLLFSVGVEFSAEKLRRMRRPALVGGSLQMIGTVALAAAVAWKFVPSVRAALFAGFLVALSSTVIALRLLFDRGQTLAPQGSTALAILVFQDLAVVPIMLFIPMLSGRQALDLGTIATTLAVSIVAVVLILFAASFVVPHLLSATIAARSRDIFILSVIVTVIGTAWLTSRAGLSTALGAFVAGIVISESEYSHQVLADVLPFRETFNSLFFVSIGMLLDPAFLVNHLVMVLGSSAAVLAGKTAMTALAVALLGYPMRIAVVVSLFLAHIGEFSLVLLTTARPLALFDESFHQMALSVILVTMLAAPFLARVADRVGRVSTAGGRALGQRETELSGHTVIIGYGLNGQNVAASLRANKIPYAILEMNPRAVRAARGAGEPIYFGDAVSELMLGRVGIQRARCAVFAISDPVATRRSVAAARRLNPELYIIARTRYVAEIDELYLTGADTVITEEFETSLEITRRVLGRFAIPPATIDREILAIRRKRYEMFRGGPIEKVDLTPSVEPFEAEVRKVAAGKSLSDLRLRKVTGATVIAVRRDATLLPNPAPDFVLNEGDHVYLIGSEEDIRRALRLL